MDLRYGKELKSSSKLIQEGFTVHVSKGTARTVIGAPERTPDDNLSLKNLWCRKGGTDIEPF